MAAPIVVLVDDYAEVQHVEWVLGWQVRIVNASIFKAEFVVVVVDAGSIGAGNALEVVASRTAEALADGTSTEIDLVFLEDRAEDRCIFLGIEGGRGGDGWSRSHFWLFVRLGDLNGLRPDRWGLLSLLSGVDDDTVRSKLCWRTSTRYALLLLD